MDKRDFIKNMSVVGVAGVGTMSLAAHSGTTSTAQAYTADGGSAVPRNLGDKLQEYISVKDFGAVGDGLNDDSIAVQNAITESISTVTEGAVIHFPPGRYRFLRQVIVPHSVILCGSGINSTRINGVTDVSPFLFKREEELEGPFHGGGICDMSISCSEQGMPVHAIEVQDCWGVFIHRIKFRDGPFNYGVRLKGYSFETDIRQCRFESGVVSAISIEDHSNSVLVENCDFAVPEGGTSIRVLNAASPHIAANHFEFANNTGGTHIYLEDCKGAAIYGNKIGSNVGDSAVASIHVSGASRQTSITGNRLSVSGGNGILFDGSSKFASVTGNSFVCNVGKSIVYVNGRPNIVIASNNFEVEGNNMGDAVIRLGGQSKSCTIHGNSIAGSDHLSYANGTGIILEVGVQYCTTIGNVVSNMALGINCQADESYAVQNISGNILHGNQTPYVIENFASINFTDNII